MNKSNPESGEPDSLAKIAEGLEDVKRLLIFALMRSGASQGDVAKALGVNQSSISRLVSKKRT